MPGVTSASDMSLLVALVSTLQWAVGLHEHDERQEAEDSYNDRHAVLMLVLNRTDPQNGKTPSYSRSYVTRLNPTTPGVLE